jgi:hypothetical protein
MFHIDRAFRTQGRQVGTADVGMQRRERLSENGFMRRAAFRSRRRQPHGAELTAVRSGTRKRGSFCYAVDRPDAPTVCLVAVFAGVTRLKILPSGSLNHAAFIVPAT